MRAADLTFPGLLSKWNVYCFYYFSLWCATLEGGTGQDRKRCGCACTCLLWQWSVYMTVIYLLSLLECSSFVLLWQLSFCQCFMPSCCQAHLKDFAFIHCFVCYRQLITLVWTAMWCSVSSICLMMLSLGTIRWGMHSVCTVNTCYACSFIVVINGFHLGEHGQWNDNLLKLNEVRHTLDTWDSQGIHRGLLEMSILDMKSDNFTSIWNMYWFWQ